LTPAPAVRATGHSWSTAARGCAVAAALLAAPAHASLFHGDTLDAVADVVAWVAIVIAPLVAIVIFWLLHIMPEKIAEKKHHPQAKAIQVLCVLSLFFGGLLWPLAWLWAYTKPVFHKMAYGTDVAPHDGAPEHGVESSNVIDPLEDTHVEPQRIRESA
jgi:CBS domain containing-hemolysin-like protein